jgi:Na+-driven multidrug efflux pump
MNIARDIFTIGIASFAQIAATSVSAVFVNRVLGTYGGDMAISAYGIINRVIMFALMPGIVIGQGLQPILGFNYGARRYDRVLKSIKIASIAATICCIAAFIVLNFFPEPIIKIFTADLLLIESSSHATGYVFRAAYLLGITMLGSLVFQSIGKATQSMVTSLVRPLFLIPLIFILPKLWQVDGVWLSFPISDAIAFTLTMVLLIRQIREFKSSDSLKAVESLQVGS